MASRGIKLYNSAIAASMGAMLSEGDYHTTVADSEWIDVAGQYLPLSDVEGIMSDITTTEMTLENIVERFDTLMGNYKDMAAAYAYSILSQLMGHKPSDEEVEQIIASSKNIIATMREVTEADRVRDAGFDMMVGYGYDFRDGDEHRSDFLNSR
jgi:hypothetical protein